MKLGLKLQQASLIARFVQGVDQAGCGIERHREAALASSEPQRQRGVSLAGSRVAQGDDIVAPGNELAAGKFEHQHLVDAGDRGEVERVDGLDGWEARLSDAALDHAPLAIDQLHLDEAQEIARMVDLLGGAKGCNLVVLAQDRRQLELLEVMGEQHLWRGANAAISMFWAVVRAR